MDNPILLNGSNIRNFFTANPPAILSNEATAQSAHRSQKLFNDPIVMLPILSHAHNEAHGRFNLMLAMFAFDTPLHHRSSVLCRVLDGRELVEVCPVDEAIVSTEERVRYRCVRDPRQRALAFRARAELRRMLGRETELSPQMVPIEYDVHGKPRCYHPRAYGLDFSVTHADDCAIIALGEVDGIGVDAEMLVTEEPSDELLEIVFSDEELEQWRTVPAAQRRRAFTEAWTIKEATLKAVGSGIDGSPHDLTVRFTASGHAEPVFKKSNWFCERVNFCPCYAACCVVILPSWENPRHVLAA